MTLLERAANLASAVTVLACLYGTTALAWIAGAAAVAGYLGVVIVGAVHSRRK
ncbi:hypothetical protein L3Q67_45270 (plasmid) [Saccharothrix sp. AJ9571]|nr:hypothetical protein L3Q67_45270 [Saccharothrix sp. AJ9571]